MPDETGGWASVAMGKPSRRVSRRINPAIHRPDQANLAAPVSRCRAGFHETETASQRHCCRPAPSVGRVAALSVRNITRRFGATRALDDVSLDVAAGAFVTLLGASGCGKSTLLRIIAGLDAQDAGHVLIDDAPVDGLRPRARDVAMVFQSYALYPYMTVAQNIALPLEMRRLSAAQRVPLLGRLLPGASATRRAIAAEVRAVADGLAIGALLARKPAQLSGGQRQRVALARAMVRHPKLFLMDEPLSNLDQRLRVQARAEIAALHRRLGATFVYVTHDQDEAMTMSDLVAVMDHGRILQVAAPQALYDDPVSLAVATFVGQPRINLIPATPRTDGVLPLGLRVQAAGQVTLALRPEALRRDPHGWPARVTLVEHLGPEVHVHAVADGCDAPLVLRMEPRAAADLSPGAPFGIAADAAQALLFDADGARLRVPVAAIEGVHA
jgi:multiple sugar transport system ATP-binding protein